MRVLLVSANRERLPSPVLPLGVLAVASSLREAWQGHAGHEVTVADLCFEDDPLAALREAVKAAAPDVVGVGIRNLHTNAYDGSEELLAEYAAVVRTLREVTGKPIVLGGSGFSLRPETLLRDLGGDYGVVGEGERAMRHLVDALHRGVKPPRLVSSAAAARENVAAISSAGLAPWRVIPIPAAAGARPRRPSLLRKRRDREPPDQARVCLPVRLLRLPGSGGTQGACPGSGGHRRRVRRACRSPRRTHVFFVDSVFNVPRAHALAVCRALIARGSPAPWVCYGSPASFDDELVAAMAEARCAGVEVGTDTGTEAMLRRLRKPFTLREVRETRALFVKHGILDAHTFVLGAEEETAEEARATLAFVDELDPDVAVFVAFLEDREERRVHRARHRAELLALLTEEAPRRPGWVVPELSIRFGPRVTALALRSRWKGPSWLKLAAHRRGTVSRG